MKSAQIAQIKRALGAILNLIRYKTPLTVEEANVRLQLIDQVALEALGQVNESLSAAGRGSPTEQPAISGRVRRLQEMTEKVLRRSITPTAKKRSVAGEHRRPRHASAS